MRTISKRQHDEDISRAIARERARRCFEDLSPEERDAEIDRHLIDMNEWAVNELIARVIDDPFQQEVQFRQVERVTRELAGPTPTPLVKLLAKTVAVLTLERDLADRSFYSRLGGSGGVSRGLTRELLRWREFLSRRLNNAINTLATVRHFDAKSIQNTVDRLKIAG
jgi:hypothetical protein